jgi:hypothetical protein
MFSNKIIIICIGLVALFFFYSHQNNGSFMFSDKAPVNGAIKNRPNLDKNQLTNIGAENNTRLRTFAEVQKEVGNYSRNENRIRNSIAGIQRERIMCAYSNKANLNILEKTPGQGEEWFRIKKSAVNNEGDAKIKLKEKASIQCDKYQKELGYLCEIRNIIYKASEEEYFGVAIYTYKPDFNKMGC